MAKRLLLLLNRVLVEKITPPSKTNAGILLPEKTAKLNSGKVVADGLGCRDLEGKLIPVSVKEGDTVLLPEYGGTEVKLGEKESNFFRVCSVIGLLILHPINYKAGVKGSPRYSMDSFTISNIRNGSVWSALAFSGIDLPFEWDEIEAFVRQPDGSLFSWCERFHCYNLIFDGIVEKDTMFGMLED